MSEEEILKICKDLISMTDYKFQCNYTTKERNQAIQGLLDLYNKEKEENEKLEMENSVLRQVRKNLRSRINMKRTEWHSLCQKYDQRNEQIESLKKEIKELNSEFALNTEIHKRDEEIKELKETIKCLHEPAENYISKDKVLKAMGYEENDEEYEKLKQDDEKLLSILDTMYSEFCRLEDIEDQKVEVAVDFIEKRRDKHWQDKIRKRLEKLKDKEQELSDEQGYWGGSELQAKIEELEEFLEEQL